ncbi:MAG TPA: hypothetical protein VLI93_00175, partial [Acetobacteraceae bacterium]|nr:hypothetical protein [Acetobacteraceae bacterium]
MLYNRRLAYFFTTTGGTAGGFCSVSPVGVSAMLASVLRTRRQHTGEPLQSRNPDFRLRLSDS